ncbi:hypothetical protein [Paracoccus jiaweipingae]|uniref:hypothetical protein n=1 Tax=unclassified Paracoccus (in: a-proteobacteria) TaxID=2688777 RepID=UPI0037AF5CAE
MMADLRRILAGDGADGPDRPVLIGAAVSLIWVVLVLAFWLFGPEGGPRSGLDRLLTVAGVLLPLGLIWLAVGMARTIAALRDQAQALRQALPQAPRAPGGTTGTAPINPQPANPQAAARPQPAPARAPAKPAARPQPQDTRQSAMPLDPPQPVVHATPDQLVAALNFPEGPDDRATIAALHAVLKDPDHSRLIRAAQDIITLLADRGIYMDFLPPASTDADLWRRFASGERGGDLAALARPTDPEALDSVTRMRREDDVFRDAVHHFLRHFDRMLTAHAPALDDNQIAALADTRSGRAFTLLGQVVGVFG